MSFINTRRRETAIIANMGAPYTHIDNKGTSPIIFSSPHSGRIYPANFIKHSALSETALRRNEDCYVDQLFDHTGSQGAEFICARFPRCYVDLNRGPRELPAYTLNTHETPSPRARAGLGAIPSIIAENMPIYSKPLSRDDIILRMDRLYHPYHRAITGLLARSVRLHGHALLIDCHSMPPLSPSRTRRPDIILGDRFGVSCTPQLTNLIQTAFEHHGYSVSRNYPYAGGYVTQHYGRPHANVEAIQIEINRDLYINSVTLQKTKNFALLKQSLMAITAHILDAHDTSSAQAAE